MNRITKVITTIATSIISLDILLMVINGTMLYVLLTLAGFYVLACLAFKQSAYKATRSWIDTGHLPIRRKLMSKLTTKSLSTTTDVNGLVILESNGQYIYPGLHKQSLTMLFLVRVF